MLLPLSLVALLTLLQISLAVSLTLVLMLLLLLLRVSLTLLVVSLTLLVVPLVVFSTLLQMQSVSFKEIDARLLPLLQYHYPLDSHLTYLLVKSWIIR
jgi:hypothetical protein